MRLRNVVLVSVVLLAGAGLALEFAARSAAVRLARNLAPAATLGYESAHIALDGSIRLGSPRLELGRGPWKGSLRARVANLRGPDRFWLVRHAFSSPPAWPAGMTMTSRGLSIEETQDPVISGWAGIPDLALFENVGCGSDALSEKDRLRMGIRAGERVDTFTYRYEASSMHLELSMSLNSEDIARWYGTAEITGFTPERWSESSGQQELRLQRAALSYQDPGYLSRRNKFCADWLGITPAQFVERHVAALRTFLAARGIDPGEDVLGLYERLVNRGGSLNLASLPDAAWVPAETSAYPRQVLLRLLNVTIRIDDAPPIMMRLGFTEPEQPLYVVASGLPDPKLADVLSFEETGQIGKPGNPGPAFDEIANTMPETSVVAAPPVPADPPSKAPAAVQEAEAPSPAVAIGPESAGDPPAMRASAPPPPENSTLALVWKPGQIERLPPAKAKELDYDVVATSSLGNFSGRRVQLLTTGGKQVDGDVQSVDSGNLVLLIGVGRGSAQLNVPLANIREARLMRPRKSASR